MFTSGFTFWILFVLTTIILLIFDRILETLSCESLLIRCVEPLIKRQNYEELTGVRFMVNTVYLLFRNKTVTKREQKSLGSTLLNQVNKEC